MGKYTCKRFRCVQRYWLNYYYLKLTKQYCDEAFLTHIRSVEIYVARSRANLKDCHREGFPKKTGRLRWMGFEAPFKICSSSPSTSIWIMDMCLFPGTNKSIETTSISVTQPSAISMTWLAPSGSDPFWSLFLTKERFDGSPRPQWLRRTLFKSLSNKVICAQRWLWGLGSKDHIKPEQVGEILGKKYPKKSRDGQYQPFYNSLEWMK